MLLVKDTKKRFGVVSVALHWYIAATIFFLLPTGTAINYLSPQGPLRPLRFDLIWWHLSFAVTAVPFFLYRIYWRLRQGKPKTHTQHWTLKLTADTVWRLLLVAIVCQIITGPSLQLSHQYVIHWFGITFIPVQPWLTDDYIGFFHSAHIYGAEAIAILLVLHIGGALKHYIIDHDQVLQRILWPFAPKAEADADSSFTKKAEHVPLPAGE